MTGWLGDAYLWVKAAHVVAVIFWMAGMFMLPRYLAYHCETAVGSAESEAWKRREKRILRLIINPAMILTWILGLLIAWAGDYQPRQSRNELGMCPDGRDAQIGRRPRLQGHVAIDLVELVERLGMLRDEGKRDHHGNAFFACSACDLCICIGSDPF